MLTVTVSPKYQIVIPKEVRDSLQVKPGEQFQVIEHEGRIEYIPVIPMKKARGLLKGMDTNIDREGDRI